MDPKKPDFQIGDRVQVVGAPHVRGTILKIFNDVSTGAPARAELVLERAVNGPNRFDINKLEHAPITTTSKFALTITSHDQKLVLREDGRLGSAAMPTTEDLEELIRLTRAALAHLEGRRDEWRAQGSPQPFPEIKIL